MKRIPGAALCFAVILFAAPASSAPQGSPLAGQAPAGRAGAPLLFRNQVVFDQQGLGLEVFRMLVPKDWVFNGGIAWNFAKSPPEGYAVYTVASPDGNSVIQQFPMIHMFWSPDPQSQYSYAQTGSTILQPMGAIDYLQRVFIPQVRQGVGGLKVVETQPLPGAAQQALAVSNLILSIYNQISPFTSPFETREDAGRVKVEYTLNGRPTVEDFTATINYSISNGVTMSGMYVQNVLWGADVHCFRAPAEEMPARIRQFQVSLYSRSDNPVWQVSYTRLCALVTREKIRQQQAIFARYQQIHQTLEECNDIIRQTYENRSAAQDRMFDGYIQSLRGVETYVDPVSNRKVDLPTGYDYAWTNGTDYVLSDSANFDPNVISNGNWQKLARKR